MILFPMRYHPLRLFHSVISYPCINKERKIVSMEKKMQYNMCKIHRIQATVQNAYLNHELRYLSS